MKKLMMLVAMLSVTCGSMRGDTKSSTAESLRARLKSYDVDDCLNVAKGICALYLFRYSMNGLMGRRSRRPRSNKAMWRDFRLFYVAGIVGVGLRMEEHIRLEVKDAAARKLREQEVQPHTKNSVLQDAQSKNREVSEKLKKLRAS